MILPINLKTHTHRVRILRHAHINANRHAVQIEFLLETGAEETQIGLIDFLRVAKENKAGGTRLRLGEILQLHLLPRTRAWRRVAERHRVQPPVQQTRRNARSPSIEHGQRQREHGICTSSVERRDDDRRHVARLHHHHPPSFPPRERIDSCTSRAASWQPLSTASHRSCSAPRRVHVPCPTPTLNPNEHTHFFRQRQIVLGQNATAVQDQRHHVGVLQLLVRVLDAQRVQRRRQHAVRLRDARRVHHADPAALVLHLAAHRVTCQARDAARDETVLLQQRV